MKTFSDEIDKTPDFLPLDADEQEDGSSDVQMLASPDLNAGPWAKQISRTPPGQVVQPADTCPPAPSPTSARPLNGPLNALGGDGAGQAGHGSAPELEPDAHGDAAGQQGTEMETPDTVVAHYQRVEPAIIIADQTPFIFTVASVLSGNPHPTQSGPSPWMGVGRPLVSGADDPAVSAVVAVQPPPPPPPPPTEVSLQPGTANGNERSHDDPVNEALSNLYLRSEDPPWDMARKTMLARATAVTTTMAAENADVAIAMPPPSRANLGTEPVATGPDPKTIKEMIIYDKLKDMHAKATIVTTEQQRFGPYPNGWLMSGMTFFDGFNNTWFLPKDDIAPRSITGIGLDRGYQTADGQLKQILQGGGAAVERAYRWIEKETEERCAHEWTYGKVYVPHMGLFAPTYAPIIPRSWPEARVNLTMNEMVGMVCRTRLVHGKVCFPGYLTINVVIGLQGRLIATPHYVPPNVDLASLVGKLNSWDPPTASRVGLLFQTMRLRLAELKRHSRDFGYARRKVAELEEELGEPRFELDVMGSQRRRWSYKGWEGERFVMPAGKVPNEEGWAAMEGPGDVDRIREIARQGRLVVLMRPWELRARSMLEKMDALMRDMRCGRREPQFTPEQLKIVDELLASGPRDTREQARALGKILKEQREI